MLKDNSPANDKIKKAFRLIMCRTPNEKELRILAGYYNDQLKTLNKKDAQKVLNVGEYPIPQDIDKVMLAAMMKTVDTIYNLEEAITKT